MASKLLPHVGLGLTLAIGLGLILVVSGCNSTESDSSGTSAPSAGTQTPAQDEAGHDHSDHGHDDHDHGDAGHSDKNEAETMADALADFSEEDRQSAMKQHFCPVSGEMLGTMGAPEKVEVEGKSVWICCDGCKDKLLADPAEYLAKLND